MGEGSRKEEKVMVEDKSHCRVCWDRIGYSILGLLAFFMSAVWIYFVLSGFLESKSEEPIFYLTGAGVFMLVGIFCVRKIRKLNKN